MEYILTLVVKSKNIRWRKTRINIVLSKKPKLLILDEPTSALDYQTEINLIETIKKISNKIPVIVISHQRIIKKYADLIIDFDKLKKDKMSFTNYLNLNIHGKNMFLQTKIHSFIFQEIIKKVI